MLVYSYKLFSKEKLPIEYKKNIYIYSPTVNETHEESFEI